MLKSLNLRQVALTGIIVGTLALTSFSQTSLYSVEDVAPTTVSSSDFSYFPRKINDNGAIVGFKYYLNSGSVIAQTWTGTFEWPAGGSNSYGYGLSNGGIIVGRGTYANFDNRAYLYNSQAQSLFWLPCPLYSQLGRLCEAYAINESGVSVGTSDPRFLYPAENGTSSRALKWDSGVVSEIFPESTFASIAHDINASGTIAGMREYQPFLLSSTTGLTLLGSYGNTGPLGEMVVATALNDSDHAVGLHTLNSDGMPQRSFFWNGSSAVDIGTLGLLAVPPGDSRPVVAANDINNHDQVVGDAAVGFDEYGTMVTHAFIWDPQAGMRDLNDLIPSDSGIILTQATGINNSGQIAAVGYRVGANSYIQRAYRLKAPVQTRNPVIFIPGTMGSNIRGNWNGFDVQFWVNLNPITWFPSVPSVKNLTLDHSSTFYTEGLYASDVLRSVATVGVYRDFINYLGQNYKPYDISRHFGQHQGCDFQNQYSSDPTQNPSLFVFPYDWRQDNSQSAERLHEYIQCVQQFYPPGTKIDVVAHSQGGLVARQYVLQSKIRNQPHGLRKVVTIASPYLGAPEAAYKLYTGGDWSPLLFSLSIISPSETKILAPYFPSVHQLLPSRAYQNFESMTVVESGDINENGIPDEIYTFDQNVSQLNSDFPATYPGTVGAGFHDMNGQDDWRDDVSGISYVHIVGEQSQLNTTFALAVKYSRQCQWTDSGIGLGGHCFNDRLYLPAKGFGDETVPTISALRKKVMPDGHVLSLNALTSVTYPYTALQPRCDKYAEHNGLMTNTLVGSIVAYELGFGESPTLGSYPNCLPPSSGSAPTSLSAIETNSQEKRADDGQSAVNSNGARLIRLEDSDVINRDLEEYSPSHYLTLIGVSDVMVKDESGNIASINPDTGLLDNSIPELAGYEMIGDDSSMLTMAAERNYVIEFTAPDRSIGIEIVTGKGNTNPYSAIRWTDLNIAAGLRTRLTISNSSVAKLEYDADSDGEFETIVEPTSSLTGATASDVKPPTVSLNIAQSGKQAILTIGAQDDISGVKRIFYSTDGVNFQVYNSQVTIPYSASSITFYAFADDNAANRSGVYTKSFTFSPIESEHAIVRHGITLNGRIEGSVQQLLGENTTLNSSGILTGDLSVPGVPNLVRNGSSTSYGGTIAGTGSEQPTNYTITLNGSSQLAHLRTRTDAVTMPTVTAPPLPTGTRNVTINNSGQSIGDFATLKNLTLNSNVGQKSIPPGTYGSFIANNGSGFILGVTGGAEPSIYNLQSLTLNSNSQLQIVGPVIITLPSGVIFNSIAGDANNPEWLELRIASGGLTLNSSSVFYGDVIAPNGTITLNGKLVGKITTDRLVVNSSGRLEGF